MRRLASVWIVLLFASPFVVAACSLASSFDDLSYRPVAEVETDSSSPSHLSASDGSATSDPADALSDSSEAPKDAAATDAISDATLATSKYRAAVLADSPVLYTRLNENSGLVAVDEKGAYPGTYPASGVVLGVPGALAGDTDTAVRFSGATAVRFSKSPDFPGTAPFSIELWAKQTAYKSFGWTVDHFDWKSPGRNGWGLRLGDATVGLERWFDGSTGGNIAGTSSPLTLGVYHHIVGVYNGTRNCLFVDGASAGCGTTSSFPISGTDVVFALGAANDCISNCNAFVGDLDEFAVYDKALDATRIVAHYTAGITP